MTAGDLWREALAGWAIPKEILEQAPENPYIHPPANFGVPGVIESSPSHARALEVLPVGGTVLDIGCGGGIAAMACVPPAGLLIGVDHQPEMLTMFTANARARGVDSHVFEGFWPAIEANVPQADVATAHHVVYNVQNIEEFLVGMNEHATKRVVLEMPQQHPQRSSAPAWKHFWGIERPTSPTPTDLMNVLQELGIDAHCELWEGQLGRPLDMDQEAHFMRIRLCLPTEREQDVREYLESAPRLTQRALATIWWDVKQGV